MFQMNWLKGSPVRFHHGEKADRLLYISGYEWREFPPFVFVGVAAVTLFAIGTALHLFLASRFLDSTPFFVVAIVGIGVFEWLWDYRRVVLFWRDGTIETPNGLPDRVGMRELPVNHRAIASIELTRECRGTGVVIYTIEGESIVVGHKLRTADARKVAVQLTKALHQLRDSIATVEAAQQAFYAKRAEPLLKWLQNPTLS